MARAGGALVLCLAADMPAPREGVEALLAAAADPSAGSDSEPDTASDASPDPGHVPAPAGWIAVADGRDQPLLTLLRLDAARAAFAGVTGGSVMRVLRGLDRSRARPRARRVDRRRRRPRPAAPHPAPPRRRPRR
ncbi:hypothetical protein MTQ22_01255, partial [Corynebacterium bovis]|uniref:hypothetical protein n=1 Tax=Corynebacterium bovis TaxID=36808 RepID=UPI0031390B8C